MMRINKYSLFFLLLLCFSNIKLLAQETAYSDLGAGEIKKDWLIDNHHYTAQIITKDNQIILDNGLLRRSFLIRPNLACIDYTNLTNGQQLLRSIEPEANIVINKTNYAIGGLHGQKEKAYLNLNWEQSLYAMDADFYFTNYTITTIDSFVKYNPQTWIPANYSPSVQKFKGKQLVLHFASKLPALKGFIVNVHYNIYDGLPLLCKWVTIQNGADAVVVDRVVNEVLGLVLAPVLKTPKKNGKYLPIYTNETNQIKKLGFQKINALAYSPFEGQLNSAKLVLALQKEVQAKGVQILFNTEVKKFKSHKNGVTLKTNLEANLETKQLLICTNGFAKQLLPALDVVPARGQVFVTEPIPNLKFKGTFHFDEGFYYFRNIGNRLLLGGARNKDFKNE